MPSVKTKSHDRRHLQCHRVVQNGNTIAAQRRVQLFCYSIILLFSFSTANAYRIEISNPAIANTSIFLASYYGDQVSVIDSVMTDAAGNAVFERDDDLELFTSR